MGCAHIKQVEKYYSRILSYEGLEGIKRVICDELCQGVCKDIYMEESSQNSTMLCITNCPELDSVDAKHCITTESAIKDRCERHGIYCPCGNREKWIKFSIDKEGDKK